MSNNTETIDPCLTVKFYPSYKQPIKVINIVLLIITHDLPRAKVNWRLLNTTIALFKELSLIVWVMTLRHLAPGQQFSAIPPINTLSRSSNAVLARY